MDAEVLQVEREAGKLEVHAVMAEDRASAENAVARREESLSRLDRLVEIDTALHGGEQRLASLERDLVRRIRNLDDVIDILSAARSSESVETLVDRALAHAEGSALEDVGDEADF